MIIVIPIANYFALNWLDGFAYRVGMEQLWWIYLLPGIIVLLIALFSISGQTVKAARANPVNSLKYE
jgi:putative ABC transport system permease protein